MADYMLDDSGSEDDEIREHEAEAASELKSGKLQVVSGEGTFRCPFCVSKKKQEYKYHELLAHSTGQAKSIRGDFVMGGKHRALSAYLQNELKHFAAPAAIRHIKLEQAVPQRTQVEVEGKMLYPWVVLIYNIQTVQTGGRKSSAGAGELKERFQEYCPEQVKTLWDFRGPLGVAAITFSKDMLGYGHSRALETNFLRTHHGKHNWLKNKEAGCLGTELYGWMATPEDCCQSGPVGKYLTDSFTEKTMFEMEEEKMRAAQQVTKQLAQTISTQSAQLENALTENDGLRYRMEAEEQARKKVELEIQALQDRHKQEMEDVQAKYQRMQEDGLEWKQRAASLSAELKSRQEQLNTIQSGEAERLENERRIEQINKEMELRNKQHNSSVSILKKHENENQVLAKEIQEKQLSLAKQQHKEVKILQLQGELETEKLKEQSADQSNETIKKLEEQLKELEEEKEDAQDMVNKIAMMHRSANDIVTTAQEAAVEVLRKHGCKSKVGIRRMGEIDTGCWKAAFQERFPGKSWQMKMAEAVSVWEERIKMNDWFPYKNVDDGNKLVQVVKEEEPELKKLKKQYGENVYNSVATALLEISQYNPSGRYPVATPWNHETSEKATLADVINHLGAEATRHKIAAAASAKKCQGLEEQLKELTAALGEEHSSKPTTTRGRGKRTLRFHGNVGCRSACRSQIPRLGLADDG